MAKILDNNQEFVADSTTTVNGNGALKPLEKAITEAVEFARTVCQTQGDASSDCAVAWDVVEELRQASRGECWGKQKPKTSLQQYCDEHPDAGECRVYDL